MKEEKINENVGYFDQDNGYMNIYIIHQAVHLDLCILLHTPQ